MGSEGVMTHDLLVNGSLRILEVPLRGLEAFLGSSARGIELSVHLVANVLQDMLLHLRVELKVGVFERLEGHCANQVGLKVENKELREGQALHMCKSVRRHAS